MALTKEQLLAEFEEILRQQPPYATFRHDTPENLAWTGRLVAAIANWNPALASTARSYAAAARAMMAAQATPGVHGLRNLMHEAVASLRLETLGPVSTAVGHGLTFGYFDEIRKIIATASSDLLVVDPYLDADFASRYLQDVKSGVQIRLLSRERMASLVPAVQMLAQQNASIIEVRAASNFHDRYVFIDRAKCYQSGASFKDGAKNAPTTITEITDAFSAVFATYENMWQASSLKFP